MSSIEGLLDFSWRKKLPVVLQAEAAECGLASLAMVLGFYGYHTDLASLRRRFAVSNQGLTLKDLMAIASSVELLPRALQADVEDLDQVQLPCVLHWGMNHFVVLKKITRDGYWIHDPAMGERKVSPEAFDKGFTGIVLELSPTQHFEKKQEKQTLKLSDFWGRIVGLKRSLGQIIALSLLLQVFALFNPLFMQTVVDDVLLRKDTNLLVVLAIGFSLLMLISVGTGVLRQFVVLHLTTKLSMQMSSNLFKHLIRLPMKYFSTRHLGDIVSRFQSLDSVRDILTNGMVTAVVDGLMAILVLVAMLVYDVQLAFIVIGLVVLYGLIRWAFYRPFHLLNEEVIVASANENSHFMESMRAIQTIKVFQKENDRQNQWQNKLAEVMNREIRVFRWEIGYSTIKDLIFGFENIIVIYIGALAVMQGDMSLGMLYAFISYKSRFIGSIDSLIDQWLQFKMLGMHLDRLADIIHTEPEQTTQPLLENINEPTAMSGHISVRGLAFRYSDQTPYVFENLNFDIQAGEAVALIGPSGCGKSTLLKCLMGLITPTEGEILIDGKPLSTQPHYRRHIAGVMQEDQLLAGDIADNIACFDPNMDMDRVMLAAAMACIDEDIQAFAMGYNTLIGDMGANLSGGQKQRLTIARALYRQPSILFMDEATSHLDLGNEKMLSDNIKNLPMTRVIVAHRPETIATVDRQIPL